MALLAPNASEQVWLENILNITAPQTLLLKLYTNDKTPAEADTEADYTVAVGFGYADVSLTPGNWVLTPGAPTLAAYPQVIFTFTGALGNVYGYYITQTTSGKIMWAERFPSAPHNVVNNGDQVKVTPKVTLE